ncbi:MAG: activator of prop osmoprotectant transporter [Gammaproteobacteria bacterium]|nr:activator of prop osmoprotectant transporter [Gammaproteobacteria bacterium]
MKKNLLHPRTEDINLKQKVQCRQERAKALNWLVEKFPKAFNTSESIHPLRIGIMEEILEYAAEAQQSGISKSKLRQAVVVFTRRIDYLACLKAQECRINLMGESCELVTEEEASMAAQKIKKRIEKNIKNQKKSQEHTYIKTYQTAYDNHQRTHASERDGTSKKIEIVFKNKTIRNFDPEAVNRLKSKLGLSPKVEV